MAPFKDEYAFGNDLSVPPGDSRREADILGSFDWGSSYRERRGGREPF